MGGMDDLVQFLRARLKEDERTARGVLWEGSGNTLSWDLPASATVEVGTDEFYAGDSTVAQHIARHDPARVLAEVDAKRRIVDHVAHELEDHGADNPWWYDDKLLPILRLLALPYADHADYRAEWRPAT